MYQQLLHCRYVAPGTRHVKRGDSLVVFCCNCNPIYLKKHVNHVTAGGLCINSTCCLCACSWKVTCSKVQWCEAFFCVDVGVYMCMDGKGGMSFKEAIPYAYNINKGYTKKDMSRLLLAWYMHLSAANVHCSGVKELLCSPFVVSRHYIERLLHLGAHTSQGVV